MRGAGRDLGPRTPKRLSRADLIANLCSPPCFLLTRLSAEGTGSSRKDRWGRRTGVPDWVWPLHFPGLVAWGAPDSCDFVTSGSPCLPLFRK